MSEHIIVQVTEVIEETPLIRSLRLTTLDGTPFPPFEAGAHIDVVGPTGVLRQYSLASDPRDPSSVVIAVKREDQSRGGSAALHQVEVGDHLKIGKPRNLLALAEDADRHLLIAGGIGVTPLLSMAYELHSRGADFELHYFARALDEVAFRDLLESRAEFRGRVTLHIGRPRAEHRDIFKPLASSLTPQSHVYTCGPVGFMENVSTVFAPVVGDSSIHIEHFVGNEIDTSGDKPFTVELDTGQIFEIPADRSILSVLEENGVEVFKSCQEGVCGSCISGVLEGTPDHRDNCLSASDKAAGKEIALCVSRSLSEKLIIELY
ncbi:PDR/VanB family oxidoreductase [Streptomyces sp. NPDC029554]|uniref:PDR/VanB family oxidoreductase n=1 Tax=Streptomyces sp. NPDC029554 TaxID=3155126 RepID=UPI0033F7CE4D